MSIILNNVTNVERGHCAPSYFSAPPLEDLLATLAFARAASMELRKWQLGYHMRYDDKRRGAYHHRKKHGKAGTQRACHLFIAHGEWPLERHFTCCFNPVGLMARFTNFGHREHAI